MVDAAVVAENRGFSDAMRRSWDATADNVLPIGLAILTISLPMIIGFAMMFTIGASGGEEAIKGLGLSIVVNLLLYASQISVWYFGVALYQLLLAGPAEAQLNEVFA
jgi:hypothetical protein